MAPKLSHFLRFTALKPPSGFAEFLLTKNQ